MKKILISILALFIITLSGCTTDKLAPVEEEHSASATSLHGGYRVKSGDTLYSIAWAYGTDYRELAAINHIEAPTYKIRIGQVLTLSAGKHLHRASHSKHQSSKTHAPKANKHRRSTESNPPSTESKKNSAQRTETHNVVHSTEPRMGSVKHWTWPAKGKVVRGYSPNGGLKGIDIAGKLGEPVTATADGKVVYSGRGLRGYGELIIIKHNSEFLSAYAHNSMLLVKEGDNVKVGQMIAKMGNTDASQVVLHFEIRRAGKPVNPLDYLARK